MRKTTSPPLLLLLLSLLATGHSHSSSSSTPTAAALAGGDLTALDAAPACWEAVINVTVPGRAAKRLDARYLGGGGSAAVATARLVHVGGGCKPVAPANLPHPWVALAPLKGDCPPAERVRVFGRAGAAAVLLYGSAEEVASASSGDQHGSNASAMVTESGDDLLRMLNNSSMVTLSVSPLTACARNYGATVNRTSVLFVSISFVVLMIISLAWLVFYYVQRFRYIHAKDRLSRRLCSAAKKALSKIPTKNIKSEDKEIQGDGECCAVCIEPYKVSDVLRILPCRHEFHKSCIDPWLLEHRTCPMCKMDILKHYGFVFTGSQESILHMEIEEVVGLGTASRDTESLTASPQIRPSGQVHSAPSSPDLGSHNSGASTPNELSPALGTGPRFASSRGGIPSGRINSTAVCIRDQLCSNCGSELLSAVPEDSSSRGVCVVELGRPAEQQDCDSDETNEGCGDRRLAAAK